MATLKRVCLTGADHSSLHLALLRLFSAVLVIFALPLNAQSVDPTGIIQPFLPQGAQLLAVQSADLDGDKLPETIASYKVENLEQGAMVLQQKGGRWEKVWEQKGPGEFTLTVNVVDLTGDGQPELLLDWITGYVSAGNDLDVYGWKDGTVEKLATAGYHKLDWLPPKQGKRALAVWEKDIGMAFMVKTLRLEEHGWVNADDQYAEYFREVVVPYDQQLVEQMPGARFAWYSLAEAQVKAQMPQEALKSIEQGLSLDLYYPGTYEFERLKDKALLQLKN